MIKRFEDVLDIINGKNQKKVENPSGAYPIYGSGGVMGYADDYLCEANTVVIGRKGSINNPIYVEEPFWNVDTAFGLVARENALLPRYLYFFCVHYDFNKLNTTVTIPSLTKANLLKIEMNVPGIDEQKKIIEKLDSMVKLIQLQKKQIKQLDTLIKSRFLEMFGDPVKNAKNWDCISCEEATSKIGSGATPKGGKESYKTDGITLIRSMNVYNSRFEYKDLAHITDEQAKKLDNVVINKNDILLNITGASVARCCIVPEEVLPARVNQHVSIIRCKDMLLPEFVCYMLTADNYQKTLWEIATNGGATREAITKQQIEKLVFIVPPLKLQNQFATFVHQIDKSKLTVQKSLEKLEILKKSLMQQYFG